MPRPKRITNKDGHVSHRITWRCGGRSGTNETVTFADARQARHAATYIEESGNRVTSAQVYSEVLGLPMPADRGPTVRELSQTWLRSRRKLTPLSRAGYQGQLDRVILPMIGDQRVTEVACAHVSAIIEHLQDRGFKASTITRYYSVIHSMLRYAVEEGLIGSNPARRTDWVRDAIAHDDAGDDADQHVYMTRGQVQRIVDCADEDARDAIRLLHVTGARWSEATAVSVGSVVWVPLDGDGGVPDGRYEIAVTRAWKWNGKKGSARDQYLGATKGRNRRRVPMPRRSTEAGAEISDWLADLTRGRDGDEFLVHAPGDPMARLDYDWFLTNRWEVALGRANRCPDHPPVREDGSLDFRKMAASSCGCPCVLGVWPTFHDLRHTFVSLALARGVPVAVVSRWIGHRSTKVTEEVYYGRVPRADGESADLAWG